VKELVRKVSWSIISELLFLMNWIDKLTVDYGCLSFKSFLFHTKRLTYYVAQNFREERQQVTSLSMPSDGQGLYESCPLHWGTSCLNRLKQIASGGFKLVLNYDQMAGSAAQEIAYLDQAQALGMKVIFAMNNPALWDGTNLRSWYASLGVSCNCNDNVGFIEYVVHLVKNHPALWGYYIGDEVNPANHPALKAFSDLVHRTDAAHPRLFVSCSQCAHTDPPYVASLISMTDSADVVAQIIIL